jgi:hypothetical protein
MNRPAVGQQNSLLRVKHKLPEFVNKSFVFQRFVHVKKMSKLCRKKSKTFLAGSGEDSSATRISARKCEAIVTPNEREDKKNR